MNDFIGKFEEKRFRSLGELPFEPVGLNKQDVYWITPKLLECGYGKGGEVPEMMERFEKTFGRAK